MNLKLIKARFKSVCAATGATIPKGNNMWYNYSTQKCYTVEAGHDLNKQPDNEDKPDPAAGMIEANENAYFDNFARNL